MHCMHQMRLNGCVRWCHYIAPVNDSHCIEVNRIYIDDVNGHSTPPVSLVQYNICITYITYITYITCIAYITYDDCIRKERINSLLQRNRFE
jgi:hypothetical protein